jgi:hypothetical protein
VGPGAELVVDVTADVSVLLEMVKDVLEPEPEAGFWPELGRSEGLVKVGVLMLEKLPKVGP